MRELDLKKHELILECSENSILGSRGDFILGYEIEYPEKYSINETDISEIQGIWHNALKNLPTGVIVVKSDCFLKSNFETKDMPEATFFQKVTKEHFSGREYVSHVGYLFFVYTGLDSIRNVNIKNPFIFSGAAKKARKEDEALELFKSEIDQLENFINRSRFLKLRKLDEQQIQDFYLFYFGGFEKNTLTDIEFDRSYFRSGEKVGQILSITNERNLPESVSKYTIDRNIDFKSDNFFFYMSPLENLGITLNCNHIYNQVIMIDDHTNHIAAIEKNRINLRANRGFSMSNGAAAEQIKEYLEEVSRDGEALFVRGNNTVIFWGDSEKECKSIRSNIVSIFKEANIRPYEPTGTRLKNLFYNSFFTNVSCLDENSLYLTDLRVALTLFTQTSSYKNHKEGIYFNERIYNTPVRFDFWDRKKINLQSRNFTIVAPTGGGKSVTFQHILRQLYEDGVITVIVDLGDSYVKFLKLLPAEDVAYFKYIEGEPIGLNPFALDEELSSDKVNDVCEFVWTLVKREELANEEEKTSLRKLVAHYYTIAEATGQTEYHWFEFYAFIKNNRSDILKVLEIPEQSEYFDMEQFLHNGSEFVPGGTHSSLLESNNREENFKGKKIILFELDSVKENRMLLNILLLSIKSAINLAIWNDRTNKGVVFFDEFAKQMEFPSVLDKVKYYSQAIRKQEGALGLILQSVNQLPDSPATKTIIDNSETFIFLNMKAKGYKDTVERLQLPKHVEVQLNSMQNNYSGFPSYSEIFIVRNNIRNVYRIELPKPILYAFQTEGPIHEEMMRRYAENGNMQDVIKEMIETNLI